MSAVGLHADASGPPGAPSVLLLGSLGSTTAMWDAQLPALTERFRVVRCDTRGHGRSPAPPGPYSLDDLVDDAVAVLRRLSVPRAHVVGLSLGGMVALRLAAREPQLVDRLAVLCSSPRLAPPEAWEQRAVLVRKEGTGAVADAVVGRWFTDRFRADHPAVVSKMRAMVTATPAEGYAGCCEAIAAADLRPDLPRVAAPVLAIAGEDDVATPPEHLTAIATGVRDGRIVRLPQAAHLANVERAAEVDALLLDHLTPSPEE